MDGDIICLRREIEKAAKTSGITGAMKLKYLEASYKLGDDALDEAINYLSSLKNPIEQTDRLQRWAFAAIEYLSRRGFYPNPLI